MLEGDKCADSQRARHGRGRNVRSLANLAGGVILSILMGVNRDFREKQHKYHGQSKRQYSGRVPRRFCSYCHSISQLTPARHFDAAAGLNVAIGGPSLPYKN